MRRIWAIAAFTMVATACTSAAGGDPTVPPPASTPASTPPRSITSTAAGTSTVPHTGPLTPPRPSVPADVPVTGPNAKPGEKPPVMSLEATQHTGRGARAFAVFFIKTIDWGFATINGAYIRHYSAGSCKGCAVFADGIDGDRSAGHRYYGGRLSVTASRIRSFSTTGRTRVVVTFNGLSFEEVDKKGKVITVDVAHKGERFDVRLNWDGMWTVTDLIAVQ